MLRTARMPLAFLVMVSAWMPHVRADEPLEGPVPLDDRAALESWMDGVMAAQLEGHHISGATVAVVKDGETILAKGYGYADISARRPVDAAATLFRIGSVSKLFVWLSAMQLSAQGKLDLNADVNQYLSDIKVPRRFGAPVTMKNLMSHTPGFEDQVIGLFGRDAENMQPLGTILDREMPARVRKPGHIASYSNHGTGLAMHVVEEITGQPWQDYIQSNILDPLGMDHTVLAQPVPPEYEADLSKGYAYQGRVLVEKPFEFVPLGPVGGVSASAGDMAKLMLMFLGGGAYGDARVLDEATAKTMQSDLHRMARGVNPMAYGLMDTSGPDLRIIGHGGDTIYFHTLFALFPEHNAGLFVSYNTVDGAAARGVLQDAFTKRFFAPGEPPQLEPPADFASRAARYTGAYRANRYSHRSLAKLGVGLAPVNVNYDGNGALKISSMGNVRWIEIGPNTFREADGDARIVFIEDEGGKITHFAIANLPILAFERIGPLGRPEVHFLLFVATVAMCCLAITFWPVAAIARWHYGVLVSRQYSIPLYARLLGWIAAATVLTFVLMLARGVEDPNEVAFGLPEFVKALLVLPLVVAVLAAGMAAVSFRLWTQPRGRIVWRLIYGVFTLSLIVFVWQAFYWNLTIVQNLKFL